MLFRSHIGGNTYATRTHDSLKISNGKWCWCCLLYTSNLDAIRTLKTVEAENRSATAEEQTVLAQYVGWGGLADFFDEKNPRYAELKELLTDAEYAAARESTLTAFFTPPVVIRGIYAALGQMGFTQGNILEPSCGIGNFLGMLPESMSGSKLYGVELDDLSGRIARQLYQRSSIAVSYTHLSGRCTRPLSRRSSKP